MIKVGDKYYHEGSDWLVVNIHYPTQSAGDIYHFVIENEGVQMRIPLALYYKEMCEQQKQRADILTHSIMQIRNDLIMEDKVSNNDIIDRLNNLLGVSEHD